MRRRVAPGEVRALEVQRVHERAACARRMFMDVCRSDQRCGSGTSRTCQSLADRAVAVGTQDRSPCKVVGYCTAEAGALDRHGGYARRHEAMVDVEELDASVEIG